MKTMSRERLERAIKEGRLEAVTDINTFDRVEVRWARTGKRETITVASVQPGGVKEALR